MYGMHYFEIEILIIKPYYTINSSTRRVIHVSKLDWLLTSHELVTQIMTRRLSKMN